MNTRRLIALGLAGALALSACGDDDDSAAAVPPATTAADDSASDATADDSASAATGDASIAGPPPTIDPELPDDFLDGAGPVAVVGDALPPYPEEGDDPAVGMTAPVLVGETMAGDPITIDASVDGPTWVVFLAHWCSHCNAEIPVINQLRDEGRIPDGINVVGISTAYNPGRPNWPPDEWLEEKDWTFPAVNDGIDTVAGVYIAANEFGIGGFPFSMLVDGDGVITARWAGGRTADELESLLTTNLPLA